MYNCGIVLGDIQNGNTWSSAYQTLIRTNAANFLTAINAITLNAAAAQMVYVSWYKGKNPDGTPAVRTTPAWYPIIGTAVRTRSDSQRRRLGRESS